MLDVASLLEVADFGCHRCGKPGADDFELRDQLEAALSPRALTPNGGAVRMEPFGIGRVNLPDLERFGPVHANCRPGQRCRDCDGKGTVAGERCGRCRGRGTWNVLASVC